MRLFIARLGAFTNQPTGVRLQSMCAINCWTTHRLSNALNVLTGLADICIFRNLYTS
jgi:hypothetical protein